MDKADEEAFRGKVGKLFKQEKFDQLEKLAEDLRENKVRFNSGLHKLPVFYSTISAPSPKTEESYKEVLDRINKWAARYPDSITVRVAEA